MEIKLVETEKRFAKTGFMKRPIFLTDSLRLDFYCFEAGQRFPRHKHPETDEIVFCVEGEGNIQVGSETLPISANQTVLIPRGIPHLYANTGRSRLVLAVTHAPLPSEHDFVL